MRKKQWVKDLLCLAVMVVAVMFLCHYTGSTYALPQDDPEDATELVTPMPTMTPSMTPDDDPQDTSVPTLAPDDEPEVQEPMDPPAMSTDTDEDDLNERVELEYPPEESADEPISEYPPAWADSGQQYLKGNLSLDEQIRLLDIALQAEIDRVRAIYDMPDDVAVRYDEDNLSDILAIYAVKHGLTEGFPYSIRVDDEAAQRELLSIFWSMTRVSGTVQTTGDGNVYRIHVYRDKSARYGLSSGEKQEIADLVGVDSAFVRDIYENSILATLSEERFLNIQQRLEGITGERRSVLLAAFSLENKVSYFWGGKSYHTGWDNRWGEMRTVSSENSSTSGTARPLGLDCSGFVSWAFINAGGSKDVLQYIGNGTSNQWRNSKEIGWDELMPGDLLFFKTPNSNEINHVGIVAGWDENGQVLVIHCSSSRNGVVVTSAAEFNYARRPYVYGQ